MRKLMTYLAIGTVAFAIGAVLPFLHILLYSIVLIVGTSTIYGFVYRKHTAPSTLIWIFGVAVGSVASPTGLLTAAYTLFVTFIIILAVAAASVFLGIGIRWLVDKPEKKSLPK